MAVILVIDPVQVYTGLSGDAKPTAGVRSGAVFWEFASGSPYTVRKFMFDGTQWGLVTTTPAAG